MSQTTLTSYFHARKRPASEDIVSVKNKIYLVDRKLKTNTLKDTSKNVDESSLNNSSAEYIIPSDFATQKEEITSNLSKTDVFKNPKDISNSAVFSKKVNVTNVTEQSIKSDINAKVSQLPVQSSKLKNARLELSLGDIRKKLSGSTRLAELKSTADQLSKQIKTLKSKGLAKNLKGFKTIDVEVPTSPSKKSQICNEEKIPLKGTEVNQDRLLISPRKVVVSPVKSPSKVPAYLRHASLATSTTSLPLPHHYRSLGELFRGMETVVSLLFNRNEKISFSKIKPSIQEMLKRNFTEKHLAQIKQLVPDFYNFEIKKIKNFSASTHKDRYELIITPNVPSDITIMSPNVLLERRRYFYDTLVQLVKRYHTQYLQTLDPPLTIPEDKLTRWHPEFSIEKVPEVECAKLPQLPNTEKYSSAQDVLTKARELFKCNPKMELALKKVAETQSQDVTEPVKFSVTTNKHIQIDPQSNQPTTSSITILNPALRSLPASLLEKVKAKQAAKALEAMTRSSEADPKYLIYSRLPDLARTLRNIFVTERKNVLALNIILSKLGSSFKGSVSANELQRDIKILTTVVPDWAKLHDIRNTTYLKLEKNADLKSITLKLEELLNKFKSN